jgi:hypothetical protein
MDENNVIREGQDNNESQLLVAAEQAAKENVKIWIQRTFQETFYQGVQQKWKVTTTDEDEDTDEENHDNTIESYRVELSLSDINACLSLVQKLAQSWQSNLREDQHECVAQWVQEVYDSGKESFWSTLGNDGEETENSNVYDTGNPDQDTQEETNEVEKDISTSCIEPTANESTTSTTKIPYCELRALGRKRKVGSESTSLPQALKKIKEYTSNNKTYWPFDNDTIDQAAIDMTRRMDAQDKHGGINFRVDPSSSNRKVHFKVLPKSVVRDQTNDEGSGRSVDEAPSQSISNQQSIRRHLLQKMKKKKKGQNSEQSDLRKHLNGQREESTREVEGPPRPPWDAQSMLSATMSPSEKELLDPLLMHPNKDSEATESPLGLFGGLQRVGQVNINLYTLGGKPLPDDDKKKRRRENILIQERIDPHRLPQRIDNSHKLKSKILKTEDWFNEEKKFFDLDLGWCLLEVKSLEKGKRLCAFSSMEISLDDSDPPAEANNRDSSG